MSNNETGKIIMKKNNNLNYISLDLKLPGKVIFSVSLGAQQPTECITKDVKRVKHFLYNSSSISVTNEKHVNFSTRKQYVMKSGHEVQKAFSGHFQIPQTKKTGKSSRLL